MRVRWRNLLGLVIILFSAASGINLLPVVVWPQEFNRNLGCYYLAAHLIILPCVAILKGSLFCRRLFFMLLAVNLVQVAWYVNIISPFYINRPPLDDAYGGGSRVRIVFARLPGSSADPQGFREFVDLHQPDILGLADVSPSLISALQFIEQCPFRRDLIGPKGKGLLLCSRLPLAGDSFPAFAEPIPRVLIEDVQLGPERLRVALFDLPSPRSSTDIYNNSLLLRRTATDLKHSSFPVFAMAGLRGTPFSYFYRRFVEHTQLSNAAHGHGTSIAGSFARFFRPVLLDHIFYSDRVRSVAFRVLSPPGVDGVVWLADFMIPGTT